MTMPVEKPEQTHQRTESLASSEAEAEMEKPASPPSDLKPSVSNGEQVFPPFRQRVIVMVAILLAVFLIALVCRENATSRLLMVAHTSF